MLMVDSLKNISYLIINIKTHILVGGINPHVTAPVFMAESSYRLPLLTQ